ncbi:MAG: acyltransferase family protein [Bryobacterales bacterium]|nr:acyltransferase family protein [Bryobacterales bacterium]
MHREHGLDWLRIIAFTLLIFYHCGMFFVSWPWHVKNNELSTALEWPMLFLNRWRLPLLFFISGAGVAFSLRRRGFGEFARERLRRLGIPLLFGIFVVVPPQIYYERLQQGAAFDYATFYATVFQFQPYPKGSFSWHHLWFVMYLLVYCLVGIPLFRWLRSERGQRALGGFASWLKAHRMAIYLVNIPNLAVSLVLGPHWPTTHNLVADWANLIGAFLTFLWGFMLCSRREILDLLTARRREFLTGGVLVAVLFFTLRAMGVRTGMLGGTLIGGYFGMLWIFTLIGYARQYLNRESVGLRYATEAVYPFYIAHQTIIVAVGYYLAPVAWPVAVKLPLLMLVTFTGSWLTFELVRRTALTRVLFGLKPKAPARIQLAAEAATIR